MSRLTFEWTAAMNCPDDHPEIRRLYANGAGVAQEWLADRIVKRCCVYGLKDGRVTLADIKCAAAGKVSRPTLNKYIDELLECGALHRVAKDVFWCPIAERICSSFVGRSHKSVRNCKNFYTPENSDFGAENAHAGKNKLTRVVPDLEKDSSENLKAKPPQPTTTAKPDRSGAVTATQADTVAKFRTSSQRIDDIEAKSQVARQAGSGQSQIKSIADVVLSIGVSASGRSLQDLMSSMQEVDLDALDTEAVLAQNRQEAELLAARRTPRQRAGKKPLSPDASTAILLAADNTTAARATAPAGSDSIPAQPLEGLQMPALSALHQTTRALPKSVIRFNLGQLAEAIPEFTYSEKEVNALRKWPITEAQLVNLRNATVAHRGKLVVGAGAYLYGAVRRASLGMLPTQR